MFTTINRFQVVHPPLLAVVLGLMIVVGCVKHSPPLIASPAWIDVPPAKHYVGSASYGVETEKGARRSAVADAISSLLPLKAGVAMVSSDVRQKVESSVRDSNETVRAIASISTRATIDGKDIDVNVRIIEFWKNSKKGTVYVLIEDLKP